MNIAEGEDGYIDVIALFEEKYPDIDVNYTTYETNEALYTRLKNGGASYDVIIPSDYMIARMIAEDMLLPLDFENIPNYELVDEQFKNQTYDPNNEYSVPYTWGTVGIIYNTKYVDEADVGSWDLLWNEKYAGRILMVGNERDAFAIAEARLATASTLRTRTSSRPRPTCSWSRSPWCSSTPWTTSTTRWTTRKPG